MEEPPKDKSPEPEPLPPKPITPMRRAPTTPEVIELPDWITQFIGQPWFDHYFPNPTPENFPLKPPYVVTAFTAHLMKLLPKAPLNIASGMMQGFITLYRQFGPQCCDGEGLKSFILRSIDNDRSPINLNNKEHRQYVYACANVLVTMNLVDVWVAAELMSFYMVGDEFTRELMLQEFCMGGVMDPKNYFGAEMDSWDPAGGKIEELSATQQLRRRREFRKIALEWLKRWTMRFRRHLERAVARLMEGQALIAAGKRPQGARSTRRSTSVGRMVGGGDTQLQRTMDTMNVAIRAAPDVSRMPITPIETIS